MLSFVLAFAVAGVAPTLAHGEPGPRPLGLSVCQAVAGGAKVDYETLTPADAVLLHMHLLSVDPTGKDRGALRAVSAKCVSLVDVADTAKQVKR